MQKTLVFYTILASCLISLITGAPQTMDDEGNVDVLSNQRIDYNTMMTHFKDFFMYLPVMFTTFRETMTGFPKIAEGLRILASPSFEKSYDDEDDCKCKPRSRHANSNEIDKSGQLF